MSEGLRERKKRQTRDRIAVAAMSLFDRYGFEHVTVAEIAAAAEVAPATVFNYFKTKEDLIFGGTTHYEKYLLIAIRSRSSGTSVVESFRSFVLQPRGALSSTSPDGLNFVARFARIIQASPTLQARERADADRIAERLAELIAEEAGAPSNDPVPWVVASALIGVNRAMTRVVHRGASAGESPATVAADVIAAGARAFDALEIAFAAAPADLPDPVAP